MTFFSRYFWLLLAVLAFGVAGLYVAPSLFACRSLETAGEPCVLIQITTHGDEAYAYLPRAREVYDGRFPPNELHFDDSRPSVMPVLPPAAVAAFIWFAGGDSQAGYLAATFVFAAALFILFTLLGYAITRQKLWALFLGFVGSLTPISGAIPYALKSWDNFLNVAVKNFYPLVQTPLDRMFLSKIDDPLVTYLIYLPAIIVLFLFWERPTRKRGLLLGLFGALLMYTYFHYWVYFAIAAGLAFVFALVRRRIDPVRFRGLCGSVGVWAILSIPYWAMFFATRAADSADFIERLGLSRGRAFMSLPVFFDYGFYALAAFAVHFIFYRRGKKDSAALYWIVLAASALVWSVQLITGYVPHPDHWFKAIAPFLFVMLFHAAYELLKNVRPKAVGAVLVMLMALLAAKKTVNAALFTKPLETLQQEYGFDKDFRFNKDIVASWEWINSNVPGEPRIISDSFVTSVYLNGYTSARPYLPHGLRTTHPNYDIEERFLVSAKLFGETKEDVERRLRAGYTNDCWRFITCDKHTAYNLLDGPSAMYLNMYRNTANWESLRYITEEKVRELLGRYDAIEADWNTVEADYAYVGPWERQLAAKNFDADQRFVLVYQSGAVAIYRIMR